MIFTGSQISNKKVKTNKTKISKTKNSNNNRKEGSLKWGNAQQYTTNHPGVNKTGTVTSVSAAANSGFKITGTASTTPTIDWDSNVTLVLNCGNASTTW